MQKLLFAVLFLGLLVLGLLLYVLPTEVDRSTAVQPPKHVAGETRGEGEPARSAPEPRSLDSESNPTQAKAPSAVAREAVVRERFGDWNEEGEVRVEGRVSIGSLTPPDDTLRVLAFSEAVSAEHVQSREGVIARLDAGEEDIPGLVSIGRVASDGRFQVAFPGGVKRGWLAIDGRYLYLGTPQEISIGSSEVVLVSPQLGAWVHGQISLPPSAPGPDAPSDAELFESMRVTLGRSRQEFEVLARGQGSGFTRGSSVAGQGDFELRAVVAGRPYALSVKHPLLADFIQRGIEPEPGQELVLAPSLGWGGTLRGIVLDPLGAPLPDAEVIAVNEFVFGFAADEAAQAVSDGVGKFEMHGVPPGKIALMADAEGYLQGDQVEALVEDGAILEGLVLKVSAGSRLGGRVVFPSGSGVAGAKVKVSFDPAALMGMEAFNAGRGAEGKTETDTDGRFLVHGLGKGPFLVRARGDNAKSDPDDPQEWYGELAGIRPNSMDLEITLEEPSRIQGSVVDIAGNSVSDYTLAVSLVNTKGPLAGMGGDSSRVEEVTAPDGAFLVQGLSKGTWRVEARAAGYGPSPPLQVVLPDEAHLTHRVVLPPSASVSGRVLNPSGKPVAGARVSVKPDASKAMAVMMGEVEMQHSVSDDAGNYRLGGLGEGHLSLIASHADYAGSDAVAVDLEEGGELLGVDLTVRAGGSLRGLLYGKDGEPEGGTRVILQQPLSMISRFVTTQADGAFFADRLEAGSWQVTAFLAGTNFGGGGEGADEGLGNLFENLRFTMVDVVDGEETEVVLGAPPEDPVRVSGRVTVGGEPVGAGMLSFTPDGGVGFESLKIAQVSADGTYSVELNAPGRFHLQIQIMDNESSLQQQTIEFNEVVPESSEHVIDLALPVGGIGGTVQGPDGKVLASARVSLIIEGGIRTGTFLGGQYAEVVTDAAGRYAFKYLRPGVYSVAAGGAAFGGAFGSGSEHGRTVHDGIRVGEGDQLTGIDFRLGAAGNIRGFVRSPEGKPISEASVFVRDERGRLLERFSMTLTGSDGSFVYSGVAPGQYSVTARSLLDASAEGDLVNVREGSTAEVNLIADPGTTLLVEVVDSTGSNVEAHVSVFDSEGREMNGMIGFSQLMARMSQGFDSNVQRVGPLPAGTYQVEVRAADGRSATKPVVVDGRPERKIKLRLR